MYPAPSNGTRAKHITSILLLLALSVAHTSTALSSTAGASLTVEELGRMLFFDTNLSRNRTQSCATCHVPSRAFSDPRDNGVGGAASLGDDGQSLGDRNTPTAMYARFSPGFHETDEGMKVGGQFLDGRARNLAEQAAGPPLNPIEMNMPDVASVVARIEENPVYLAAFRDQFGDAVFDQPKTAFVAMTESIAAFERTGEFAPFDSKYDRFLRGEAQLTEQEDLGMTLFFSRQFTNCNLCHQLRRSPAAERETFTNYEYHNIGVPRNLSLRTADAKDPEFVDRGLLDNPSVDEMQAAGRFKVPTLRNVAVTPPYMHNGVFEDLRTVILFYNKYNSRSESRQINPETGARWAPPEVPENLSIEELETGPSLDDQRVDALVAFLKALTDRRYEHLLSSSPSR
ncbi:MAG: methylamine utilization protein MauG [Proteobacteria bacterium]|nr:MAG: methylamine utilization protein MauG [Pseudomonadota bacterium]